MLLILGLFYSLLNKSHACSCRSCLANRHVLISSRTCLDLSYHKVCVCILQQDETLSEPTLTQTPIPLRPPSPPPQNSGNTNCTSCQKSLHMCYLKFCWLCCVSCNLQVASFLPAITWKFNKFLSFILFIYFLLITGKWDL